MNFLPFVFTFLLLLTLISSFLFSSLMGTAREKKVILSQHHAYLTLLSEQNKNLFKSHRKPKKKPPPEDETTLSKIKNNPSKEEDEDSKEPPRSSNEGHETSKFNLSPLLHGDQNLTTQLLEQTAIRLIDILYGSYDFYKSAQSKNIAHTIVKQMIKDKIESLEELLFKDNEDLNQIYYKMLKGTNTGYPALSEYFCFNKNVKPIFFHYASKPVLRAALGDEFSKKIFDKEKENWQKNHRCQALTKEEFTAFVTANHASLVSKNLVNEIFCFDIAKKGLQQIHQEGQEKIRAIHPVEDDTPGK